MCPPGVGVSGALWMVFMGLFCSPQRRKKAEKHSQCLAAAPAIPTRSLPGKRSSLCPQRQKPAACSRMDSAATLRGSFPCTQCGSQALLSWTPWLWGFKQTVRGHFHP